MKSASGKLTPSAIKQSQTRPTLTSQEAAVQASAGNSWRASSCNAVSDRNNATRASRSRIGRGVRRASKARSGVRQRSVTAAAITRQTSAKRTTTRITLCPPPGIGEEGEPAEREEGDKIEEPVEDATGQRRGQRGPLAAQIPRLDEVARLPGVACPHQMPIA